MIAEVKNLMREMIGDTGNAQKAIARKGMQYAAHLDMLQSAN
ncbi:MAG: hypothetical protein U0936_25605 [Planctomycetaceae bacterium]